MSLNEWKGVSVLVTGAGKGIGAEICAALSNLGASVIALSRSVQDLEQLLEMKHAVRIIQCDLSNPLDISRARDNGELNGIDCLVNNAGIAPLEPFLDVSLEKFQATIDTNVTGVMVLSQIVARDMIKRQYHGRIVNVSSVASKSCIKDHTSYCVSKAALDMLTKMMAFELGKYQIRVNSVNPTVIMTDMGRKAWSDPEKASPILNRISLGRFAEVSEAANLVLYLLSEKSSMIQGAIIPLDGGFWCS